MMEPFIDKKTDEVRGYAFNNASENISATLHLLAGKMGLKIDDVGDDADINAEPEMVEAV